MNSKVGETILVMINSVIHSSIPSIFTTLYSKRTFNLPSIQGSRSVTGTTTPNDIGYTDVGVLPNITGWAGLQNNKGAGGACYEYSSGTYPAAAQQGSGIRFGFDASRSSNIYNPNYQEVQPKRILMYFIIKYI